jgi:hypothetical protein
MSPHPRAPAQVVVKRPSRPFERGGWRSRWRTWGRRDRRRRRRRGGGSCHWCGLRRSSGCARDETDARTVPSEKPPVAKSTDVDPAEGVHRVISYDRPPLVRTVENAALAEPSNTPPAAVIDRFNHKSENPGSRCAPRPHHRGTVTATARFGAPQPHLRSSFDRDPCEVSSPPRLCACAAPKGAFSLPSCLASRLPPKALQPTSGLGGPRLALEGGLQMDVRRGVLPLHATH